jgi:hypothetical protein
MSGALVRSWNDGGTEIARVDFDQHAWVRNADSGFSDQDVLK